MARAKTSGKSVTKPRKKKAIDRAEALLDHVERQENAKPFAHTPGPWIPVIVTDEVGGWLIETEREPGRIVATIPDGGQRGQRLVGGAEAGANAHLIAASPAMLAALERISKANRAWQPDHLTLNGVTYDLFSDWAAAVADDAIAKARGGVA